MHSQSKKTDAEESNPQYCSGVFVSESREVVHKDKHFIAKEYVALAHGAVIEIANSASKNVPGFWFDGGEFSSQCKVSFQGTLKAVLEDLLAHKKHIIMGRKALDHK